ncbi:methanol oxidation system protein MoxJ [Methylococcus geothermalis]|uniref:Methanol oxidation system protein MoxJ n=2 Tax=Methylococcus geothermalis TaxID=2681310 RepID=A0A858QC23_9GAMM|nr:methanol oxidation system protein MoxJ [Methylococcus geothermalis]QJD31321.1 methanol oxidation system protein MoxJ [Methylococcus geothermalis]
MNRIAAAGLIASLAVSGGVQAAKYAEPLKVCSAENEMPYSDKAGQGFENKLADLIGKELGRRVENVWWTDARYFVRDFLDKGLCDMVIGVDAGDPRMLTSAPYYRSGYVFVYRKDKGLNIQDWNSEALKTVKQIAFMPDTPAETMIRKIGRYNDMFNYMHSLVGFKSRRNQYVRYDPAKLVTEVANGNAEVAVLWGPAAARYVREAGLAMTVIPDDNLRSDGEKVPHHYSTSIGVRKGEEALLKQIDQILAKHGKEVNAVLEAEGIPLLPLDEKPAKTASNDQRKG